MCFPLRTVAFLLLESFLRDHLVKLDYCVTSSGFVLLLLLLLFLWYAFVLPQYASAHFPFVFCFAYTCLLSDTSELLLLFLQLIPFLLLLHVFSTSGCLLLSAESFPQRSFCETRLPCGSSGFVLPMLLLLFLCNAFCIVSLCVLLFFCLCFALLTSVCF